MNNDNLTNAPVGPQPKRASSMYDENGKLLNIPTATSTPRYSSTDEMRAEFGDFRVNSETENLSDSSTPESGEEDSGILTSDNDPDDTDTISRN